MRDRTSAAILFGIVGMWTCAVLFFHYEDLAARDAAAASGADELAEQAEIAECLAGEARRKATAWALDVRSSRGYAPSGYEAEMDGMIAASIASARAMEAWADAARQAAVDGSMTADEQAAIDAAERDMIEAEAAVHDAFASTTAGQIAGMAAPTPVQSLADGYRQAAVLSGEGTECY